MNGFQIHWIGDNVVEITLPKHSINYYKALEGKIRSSECTGIKEFVPASTALDIVIDQNYFDINALETVLSDFDFSRHQNVDRNSSVTEIPICYDPSVGVDLKNLSELLSIPMADIIEIHSAAIYTVEMFGFMPGFPYMKGLPNELMVSRKEKPALKVPAGSVAIVGKQCGIYPFESPGGWHIIGRTPLIMADLNKKDPFYLALGAKVKFVPIALSQLELHYD